MIAEPPKSIVVVEDNLDDSFLLTRQLQRAHMDEHIAVFGTGEDALEFLLNGTTPPLVIFLDLRLPGISGFDLLETVRQEPRLHAVPVVVMTGSVNPNDVKECDRLGVAAYLPKPLGLATFIKTVTHLFPKTAAG